MTAILDRVYRPIVKFENDRLTIGTKYGNRVPRETMDKNLAYDHLRQCNDVSVRSKLLYRKSEDGVISSEYSWILTQKVGEHHERIGGLPHFELLRLWNEDPIQFSFLEDVLRGYAHSLQGEPHKQNVFTERVVHSTLRYFDELIEMNRSI